MTLVRRRKEPDFFTNVPSFFDDFLTRDLFDLPRVAKREGITMPSVNIIENGEYYRVEVAAPGFKKDDFKVELDNNVLTISSEFENKDEVKEENFTRREFNYGSFQRSFTLPEDVVDTEKINAKYNDGVLNIMIPKREEVKPKPIKTIKIG